MGLKRSIRSLQLRIRWMLRTPAVLRSQVRELLFNEANAHPLAVCAIFREESPFLEEWLRFHQAVGVSHFYLYNNYSTDNFRDILTPWIAAGVVTLKDWPRQVGQLSAYRDCLRNAWTQCRWIAFIDLDEFLFAPNQLNLPQVLKDYADLPAIEVWQKFYGSSGHICRPHQTVTEAYLNCGAAEITTVKSIVNPRKVYRIGIHQSKYTVGRAVDPARRTVQYGQRNPHLDILRINHYWSRSLEDLRRKVQRGDASTSTSRNEDWHFEFERKLNEYRDDSILMIVEQIKQQLAASNKRSETAAA